MSRFHSELRVTKPVHCDKCLVFFYDELRVNKLAHGGISLVSIPTKPAHNGMFLVIN